VRKRKTLNSQCINQIGLEECDKRIIRVNLIDDFSVSDRPAGVLFVAERRVGLRKTSGGIVGAGNDFYSRIFPSYVRGSSLIRITDSP